MPPDHARAYRIEQLTWDRVRGFRNETAASLDDLVTHHPHANRNARMLDSRIIGAEAGDRNPPRRSHAYIGGELQEVEMLRTDEYRALQPDQVLLIKDFILEDPHSPRPREVNVPAPVAGHVQRVDARNGLVEIRDRADGEVIARVRHLSGIAVREGEHIAYGQSLGQQDNAGLPGLRPGQAMHVHLEMDTRYYRQCENYMADLASGRLPVQAEHRRQVQPLPVADDGTFRLGESGPRIRDLQRVMANEGHRAADGGPLDRDGVYRPSMQGALLDFQRAHGVAQTADIDPATLRFAPPAHERMPTPTAPGHPDHPDHRPGLPDPLPVPLNQRSAHASTGDPDLDRLAVALFADDDAALDRLAARLEQSPQVQAAMARAREHETEALQQDAPAIRGPTMRLG